MQALIVALLALGAADDRARALDVFVGRWECVGKVGDEPFAATLKVGRALDRTWLSASFVQTMPRAADGVRTEELWGWDADRGAYVRFVASRAGGGTASSSTGWQGDTFRWDVDGGGATTFARTTDERALGLTTADGQGRPLFDGVCRK